MNVNFQRFTRIWPSATAGTAELRRGRQEQGGERGRRTREKINFNYH